jgi:hypothetical protein
MNSQKTCFALAGLATATLLSACSHEPTGVAATFGDSVRNMIEAQTNDPSTLATPSTETIDGSDPQRLEAVLGVYRSDVAKPAAASEEVVINVDGGR